MPHFSPDALVDSLRSLAIADDAALCVALSGGCDSTVLLQALAIAIRGGVRYAVRAIHIDHQLHTDSSLWQEHCAAAAQRAGIACENHRVTVDAIGGSGVEAAARHARYEALRESIRPGEVLLTAHHADDQLETVLLALIRGAGASGLAAMPACQAFGAGRHARPLLGFTREDLETWGRERQLSWLTDPSNATTRFARNYLRQAVIPALRQRWPSVAHSATRSAAHLAEASRLLDELAAADLAACRLGPCLRVESLAGLAPARRRNLLRHWLKAHGARAPSTRKLAAVEHDMLHAREDRVPCVDWDDTEVRRHRGLLYCIRQHPLLDPDVPPMSWDPAAPITLPGNLGRLRIEPAHAGGLSAARIAVGVRIGLRAGGEKLQPAGHPHRRSLKKLLQSTNVLPWWRDRLPLLYAGRKLAAVADLWVAQEFAAQPDEPGVRVLWEGKPDIYAVASEDSDASDAGEGSELPDNDR